MFTGFEGLNPTLDTVETHCFLEREGIKRTRNIIEMNVYTRVQAENKKNTMGTFPKRFDPRIDLAPFFLPPGTVFTYHQGLLCGPPLAPLSPTPLMDRFALHGRNDC